MAENVETVQEKLGPDLTTDEVGQILNVSVRTIRLWVEQGRIPQELYYRLPGDTHFRFKPGLIDWIRDGRSA